jgi:hypothetical protein
MSQPAFFIESHFHEEHEGAIVVSGEMTLHCARVDSIHQALAQAFEQCSADIAAQGGIIGHIKASVASSDVAIFSLTDTKANITKLSEKEVTIHLVGIVFSLTQSQGEAIIQSILEAIPTDK